MTKKSDAPAIRFKGFSDAWEQRKFGDITELKSASRVHKGEWTDSGVPFFRSSDVMAAINGTTNEKAYISEELYQKLSSVSGKLEKGDVLITGGGSVGNPYIVPNNEPLYTKDADLLWIKNQGRFHPYYLYEYFFSPTFRTHLSSISHVGTIAHYTITQLSETPICLPDIEEQVKVGEYFESLDNLITLHQRKFEKLTNVKKSMLEKMFPQNGSSYPEIRFKGFTDPWEQRKFEEIAVRSSVICSDDTLPRVEYEDIVSGTGRLNKDIYAKQSIKSGIAFHQGDVLYGKLRPYLQNWLLPTFDGLAVGDFWVLQPQNADSSFLYRLIQSRQFDEVANQSTGTKMPRADWKLVSKTVFSIPSNISEQAAIGTYFTALDSLITLHQRELEKLQNIKKSMLEKMFV